MSTANPQLEAGGFVLPKAKVDTGATETIVARTYRHKALGERPVIRLASDRLGQAEDLAMEFLGFDAPDVSAAVAVQQRRSLGFAAWALINDPKNARYALDLVKRMKAAARQARSKPGHAWDAYSAMAKDLGKSARHFLPPFWEEVGRAFKDLGNQTYAGRALNKSLEAERVHALESDRARRRDVVLEFVLSGCLAGSALSEYSNDLSSQYPAAEAFAIFRDLCVRRTRGGMAPWATMPKDFTRLAKAAKLDADKELENWLEELIDAPAMGRAPLQFWKACSKQCQQLVARSPAFAVALLRHTRPEQRHYGDSKLGPWLDQLEEWGVLPYLWEDGHQGAPPLGEPIAHWFGRVIRDTVPAPKRTLEMLEKLAPRLKAEDTPLPLSAAQRYGATQVDIDVLEACLTLGIKVDDPPNNTYVTLDGWLRSEIDHPFRNQDLVQSSQDERFKNAIANGLAQALTCRGGTSQHGYRQSTYEQRAFPAAAGDRPAIKTLWHAHTAKVMERLDGCGLASFEITRNLLETTLWPETLRLFPDLAERLDKIYPTEMLKRTLQAGVFDEYGWPEFEKALEDCKVQLSLDRYGASNLRLAFPAIILSDKVHAYVAGNDGNVKQFELRLPKKAELSSITAVGDVLAISYRDPSTYQGRFHWSNNPAQEFETSGYSYYYGSTVGTRLADGSYFLGLRAVHVGDKEFPTCQSYFHDRERFWQVASEYDQNTGQYNWKLIEVDPHTGKKLRDSVPSWFEDANGGMINFGSSELFPAPQGADSPLGQKDGMFGWKIVQRRDSTFISEGIDGRRWEKHLVDVNGQPAAAIAMLRQPGTQSYLPVTGNGRSNVYSLWDPSGSTVIAILSDFHNDYAQGQITVLPLLYWHLLKVRDEASSAKLRTIATEQCAALLKAAESDIKQHQGVGRGSTDTLAPLTSLLPAVKHMFPTAPERLAIGVARVVEHAQRASSAFLAMRDKAKADQQSGKSSNQADRKSDLAAAQWNLQGFYLYGDEGKASVSAHATASAEFFKGNAKAGELPRTNFVWYSMLENLPLRSWQTYWRALAAKSSSKNKADIPWLDFLKHFHETGISQLPGQFHVMEGRPANAKKNQWGGYDLQIVPGASQAIENGDDRFVVIETQYYGSGEPYQFLRYSTSKAPAPPPGYTVSNIRKVKPNIDAAQVTAFIAAAEACTTPPLPTKDELAEVAERLSSSPAEIGLIWLGGLNFENYQSNFLPADIRNMLGMKTTEASAARQALRNLNPSLLSQLYEAVVDLGPAAPFAADRGPVFRAFEKAWQAKMPKRLTLDAALQKRLSALGAMSRWHRVSHEDTLAAAAEPTTHPLLQPRELEIQFTTDGAYGNLQIGMKNKKEGFAGDIVRTLVQLIALVHAETAAGHPARSEMPALIKQLSKLVDHANTLLDLRYLYLYAQPNKKTLTPSEWLAKHVGKTKTDKDGIARYDDGLIAAAANDKQFQALVAFRPGKLKDERDLARIQALISIDTGETGHAAPGVFLPIVAAIKSNGFQKLAKSILAKDLTPEQWPQNPMHSAPSVVKAMEKKLKVSADAAVLYAQVLALPDPTAANVSTWNGWKTAQLKNAAAELVKRKLVLEATRARAGRSIFLPGEWSDLKSPWLPIEAWKLSHLTELDLNTGLNPLGGPMVLRPFDELFAAAWKRVLDGDEPRYEEVKRKAKKK